MEHISPSLCIEIIISLEEVVTGLVNIHVWIACVSGHNLYLKTQSSPHLTPKSLRLEIMHSSSHENFASNNGRIEAADLTQFRYWEQSALACPLRQRLADLGARLACVKYRPFFVGHPLPQRWGTILFWGNPEVDNYNKICYDE